MRSADVDITYVGRSEGDYFDLYHVMTDVDEHGDESLNESRPMLEVLVDPDCAIWVAGVSGYGISVPVRTSGRAHRHIDPELEAAGIDTSIICLGSVGAYVRPRVGTLMARVYCPRARAER